MSKLWEVPMEITVMKILTVEADNVDDARVKAMALDYTEESPELDVRDWDLDGEPVLVS